MNTIGYGVKLGSSNLSIQRWHASQIQSVLIEGNTSAPSLTYIAEKNAAPIFGQDAKNRLISRPNRVFTPNARIDTVYVAEMIGQRIDPTNRSFITVTTNFEDSKLEGDLLHELKSAHNFHTVNVIDDAIAAVYAYDLCTTAAPASTVLVVDLGTKMSVKKVVILGCVPQYVGCVEVDLNLDKLLTNFVRRHFSKPFWRANGDRFALAIESLKHEAAKKGSAKYFAGFVSSNNDEMIVLDEAAFAKMVADTAESITAAIRELMKQTRTALPAFTHVIFAGGHCNISAFPKAVHYFFTAIEVKFLDSIDPMLVCAIGAAKHCGSLIQRQTEGIVFENYMIAPSSIGIRVSGGVFDVLIEQNTDLPKIVVRNYKTERNNQDEMFFKIYEGTRPLVEHNNHLGDLSLPKLPPRPAVMLTFVLDRAGLLRVTASFDTLSKSLIINYHLKRVDPTMKRVMQLEARAYKRADEAEVRRRKALVEFKGQVEKAQRYLSENPSLPQTTSTCLAAQCRATHSWILKHDTATVGLIATERRKFIKFCQDIKIPCFS